MFMHEASARGKVCPCEFKLDFCSCYFVLGVKKTFAIFNLNNFLLPLRMTFKLW